MWLIWWENCHEKPGIKYFVLYFKPFTWLEIYTYIYFTYRKDAGRWSQLLVYRNNALTRQLPCPIYFLSIFSLFFWPLRFCNVSCPNFPGNGIMAPKLVDSHSCMNKYICAVQCYCINLSQQMKKKRFLILSLPVRSYVLFSHSSNWRQVMTVTLTSFKSMMVLQHQCTCWENTVAPHLLQNFLVPTTPCIFGSTQTMLLQQEVLLFGGNLRILVSLMKCHVT